MMEIDLLDLLSFTKDLARQAGALILEGSHAVLTSKASNHHHKQQNPVDLVTGESTISLNHSYLVLIYFRMGC